MKKQDIQISDVARILFGEAPAVFMIEVLIRTCLVYICLLLALKLLGKRMTGQLTITEMAVMITLGAIVSVPMQVPERGILQGILILILAILFLRGMNYLSYRSKKAEMFVQGKVNLLIADGVLQLGTLDKLNISRQQVFSELRNKRIFNLGKVERLYLEACGLFSLYVFREAQSGLPLFPSGEGDLLRVSGNEALPACRNCGKVADRQEQPCASCGSRDFIPSMMS